MLDFTLPVALPLTFSVKQRNDQPYLYSAVFAGLLGELIVYFSFSSSSALGKYYALPDLCLGSFYYPEPDLSVEDSEGLSVQTDHHPQATTTFFRFLCQGSQARYASRPPLLCSDLGFGQ